MTATTNHTRTPEERKARMEAAHAEMTEAVEAIATSDDWRGFLRFAAKLHSYSAGNRMWLFQQSMMRGWEDLGYVAGFRTWMTLGRCVRKGEHGLMVLAPVVAKVTDDDGSEHRAVRGFKIEHVFAACQTDGEGDIPEPKRAELLTGDAPEQAWDYLTALIEAEGFTVVRAALDPVNGTTSMLTKIVEVAERLEPAAAVKTLAHELAHVLLHQSVDIATGRARCEVEAESVAYLVCGELGLASDAYTFPYVTTWAGGDAKAVTATADTALKCAAKILAGLESNAELVGSAAS